METKKNKNYHSNQLNVWLFILSTFFLLSCSDIWTVPSEYIGQWKTNNIKITVRFKLDDNEKSQFISDSATVIIQINIDKTVSGFIGTAAFENGKLGKNPSLPWETGIKYIIECGSIGQIFNNDPLDAKEVEIWLGPLNEKGKMEAELRYTEGRAVFPMGEMLFEKVKE